jgi:hypothetical protein
MTIELQDVIAVTIRAGLLDDFPSIRMSLTDAGRQTDRIADHALWAALATGATAADVLDVLVGEFAHLLDGSGGHLSFDGEAQASLDLARLARERDLPGLWTVTRSVALSMMRCLVASVTARAGEPPKREALRRLHATGNPDAVTYDLFAPGEYMALYEDALFAAFQGETSTAS